MFYFLAFPSIIITMFYKLLFPEVQSFYEVNWLPYSNSESWVKLRQQSQLCDPGIRKIEQIHKITFLLEINLSEKVAIFSESSYQFWKCSVCQTLVVCLASNLRVPWFLLWIFLRSFFPMLVWKTTEKKTWKISRDPLNMMHNFGLFS